MTVLSQPQENLLDFSLRAALESTHFIFSEENQLTWQTIYLEPSTKPDPMSFLNGPHQRGHLVLCVWTGIQYVWLQIWSLWINLRPFPPPSPSLYRMSPCQHVTLGKGVGLLCECAGRGRGTAVTDTRGSAMWCLGTFRRTGLAAAISASRQSRTVT